MSELDLKELKEYDDRICKLAKDYNLDWFPIIYETCDYYEMIGNMSYHGMPTHYNHWSFGKSFERTHQMYNLGAEGLPYELIINSDPSIAYLMRQNPMYLQILIMCHCVGHSDFFKNNRMFSDTHPETVVTRFRSAKKRIQGYIEDPSIGIEAVEKYIDAAHAIQFQTYRYPGKRRTHDEIKREYVAKVKNDKNGEYIDIDLDKVPLEPELDLLKFILEHSRYLNDWQRDIVEIVQQGAQYFMPQMRTKIMNEGWASFWHYRLMHDLNLPQEYHIPFLKSHNQVIRPHLGAINPYHLGFHIFHRIEEKYGLDRCFLAREVCHDESFIREYLDEKTCRELNLFSFATRKHQSKEAEFIEEISDLDGWKKVRDDLIKNVGGNSIPIIVASNVEPGNILVLEHQHDGRDLELNYADEVVRHVSTLWGDVVKLNTVIEEEPFEI